MNLTLVAVAAVSGALGCLLGALVVSAIAVVFVRDAREYYESCSKEYDQMSSELKRNYHLLEAECRQGTDKSRKSAEYMFQLYRDALNNFLDETSQFYETLPPEHQVFRDSIVRALEREKSCRGARGEDLAEEERSE